MNPGFYEYHFVNGKLCRTKTDEILRRNGLNPEAIAAALERRDGKIERLARLVNSARTKERRNYELQQFCKREKEYREEEKAEHARQEEIRKLKKRHSEAARRKRREESLKRRIARERKQARRDQFEEAEINVEGVGERLAELRRKRIDENERAVLIAESNDAFINPAHPGHWGGTWTDGEYRTEPHIKELPAPPRRRKLELIMAEEDDDEQNSASIELLINQNHYPGYLT